jgi:hypothetical protein
MALRRISQRKSTTATTKCNLSVGKLGVFIKVPYTTTLPIFLQKYCVLTESTNDLSQVSGFVCRTVHPNWPPTASTTAQRVHPPTHNTYTDHSSSRHDWFLENLHRNGSMEVFIQLPKWWTSTVREVIADGNLPYDLTNSTIE